LFNSVIPSLPGIFLIATNKTKSVHEPTC
jgi:hypothetical protein